MSLLLASLACMSDITQSAVPYWFAIKYPQGFKYSYWEPGHTLQESKYDMQDTDRGALTWTMNQLWSENNNVSYVIYNDESPLNTTYDFSKGHTKGILATDGSHGFWLQHSTPKWPLGPTYIDTYGGLTSNGFDYGQHFFCISLNAAEVERLAGHLAINRPNIQDYFVTADPESNFSLLAQGNYITDPICQSITIDIYNHRWDIFAKTSEWNNELYDACIAPSMHESLQVESWLRGSECGSYCKDPSVVDIKSVQFNDYNWSEYHDHSKWAIGESVICFADINRMTTQASRGGGAICVHEPEIVSIFNKSVMEANSC